MLLLWLPYIWINKVTSWVIWFWSEVKCMGEEATYLWRQPNHTYRCSHHLGAQPPPIHFWVISKGEFTLMSKTWETPKSSNRIGQEQDHGPKDFTLRFGSKGWKEQGDTNVASLFHQIPTVPTPSDAPPGSRNQHLLNLGSNLKLKIRYIEGYSTPHIPWTQTLN
jgi:hypothetical protein